MQGFPFFKRKLAIRLIKIIICRMSRSYKTEPRGKIAWRRMPQDKEGEFVFPRVIVRKPKEGDFHPLSSKDMKVAFEKLPLEYFYGLKEIELRARSKNVLDQPLGKYSTRDKKIILYSVPCGQWKVSKISAGMRQDFTRYRAKISKCDDGFAVEWEQKVGLILFFLIEVFFHELGHHYVHQYKCKRKPPIDIGLNEWLADLHVGRLKDEVFQKRL